MEISVENLLQLIGELTVENRLIKARLEQVLKQKATGEEESSPDPSNEEK